MTTLRGEDVTLIGIYGMGGLGKTTMAHKLRNRVLTENVFQEVAMTVVSQQADMSKIQVEIGGSLGLHLKDDSSETRVQKLHARLSGTKRILVILDDVWQGLELEDLGIPCDSKGCTILITSRNSDALSAMGCKVENKFGMKILSEEEAWYLFREGAGTCVDDSNLNSIAKEVVKECKGLPIALKTLGLALKDKSNASIWNDALRELRQCDADIPNYIKEVYTALKWSYNFLDSEKAKSLFLLCCLFPEDSHISLEQLTYFGMGLGIFGGIINLEDARNKTCSLTDFLKSRSLLLDSNRKDHVRMHDVVRDVCIFIAKQKGYIGGNNCTWISSSQRVGERIEILTESIFSNLRLLSLDGLDEEFEFGSAFLEGIKDLYVLCIVESYGGAGLTSLPHTTRSLINLKTLLLDSCRELKTISVVGKLRNLEILICHRCESIKELPAEMKGLNRLKLLQLTGCEKLKSIGRGIISSLVGLEELKMLGSFNGWESEDREERENARAQLRELEALTNLRCLEIDILDLSLVAENMPLLSKKIVRFRITTGNLYISSTFSKALTLWLERQSRLGDWIEKQLLKDTECLILEGNGANNVDFAKIQNIRWLKMERCESMKNVDATVFPSIEDLELESLPELQEIYDGPISSTSFQNLKELKLNALGALTQFWKSSSVCENNNVPHFTNLSSIQIYKCDSLRNLGQLSMAGKDCLPHLQTLSINKCEMMEQVFLWNDKEAGQNKNRIESGQNRQVITKVFPKLEGVWLNDLPNLTTFYLGIEGIEFPLLQYMKIKECRKMKSIIMASNEKSNSGEMTSSTADQHIDDDASLHLFCQSEKVSFSSNLKSLEMNHNPFCCHEIPSSFINGLKELTINKYEGSMSLFTLSVAANLVSLTKLSIFNCDEMIKVIEDEEQQERRILLFPKLEELNLFRLPKLVSFCDSKCEVELPSLKKVDIFGCPNMRNLSLGLVATPNLEAFSTDLTTYVGVGVDVSFDNLKKLMIKWNKNLLCHHKFSVSLFNGLEKLEISEYKGGMSLFSSSAVGNLVNLKVLRIQECDEMLVKVIEDEEEKDDGKVVSGGDIRRVVFPKLEELCLKMLPKLVSFCQWKSDVELPSLEKVEIRGCPNMENLSTGFVAAPSLKIVKINDDKDIGTIKYLNGVLQQRYLTRRENVQEINHNSLVYNRLEVLKINKYVGSMSLFTLSVAANLVSLRELSIKNCDEMIKVIDDEQHVASAGQRILLFPELKELELKDLPKLVSFCDSKCEVELPSLEKVVIQRCSNMENFSFGLIAAPKLEAFITDLTTYVGVGVAFDNLKTLMIRENENPFCDDKISVSLFNGLEELKFYRCKGCTSLFSSSDAGNLVNLRVLEIGYNYEMLVNVIEGEGEKEDGKLVSGGEIITSVVIFPKLEKLTLNWLFNLVRFCEWKCDVELPSLREVDIDLCPNMESFSMGYVAAPNLNMIRIDDEYIKVAEDLNGVVVQQYLAREKRRKKKKVLQKRDEIEDDDRN